MTPKDDSRFSVPLLFLVTGGSFIIFSLALKLLDGQTSHISLFIKIGIAMLALGLISYIGTAVINTSSEE
ncbi:MAG: hypothetical protein JNN00_01970 [Chitinophagaceae bacterium]|nr:hypothetical protein [Chitinophagaceae bacterium]